MEVSIQLQMSLNVDMVVVLDDFTDPKVGRDEALESVERTLDWARRSKVSLKRFAKRRLTKATVHIFWELFRVVILWTCGRCAQRTCQN